MPLALYPGIRYDPREPPPPGLNPGYINAHFVHANHNAQKHDALPHGRSLSRADSPPEQHRGVGGVPEVARHYQKPDKEAFLFPLSTSVKAQIIHDTAKFNVTQTFGNQAHDIQQGVYQFPLPLDATVTGFDCRIGPNKIVRGKVKAREDAQYEFNEARRQGRTGGLMEQQTAEIFTITLANIPSHTRIQAELSFMCLLKHQVMADYQVFTLTLPTFIAPRYGDALPGVQIPIQGNHFLSLGVDVLATEDIHSVKSETHAIRYTRGAGLKPCQTWDEFIAGHDKNVASPRAATVELEHRLTSLDKDLVININTALPDNAEAAQACLETHPTLENHQALMLTLPQELMTAAVNSTNDGEIIFLADRSGSMSDKIDSLKSAMMFFISGIPENQPFNIWCFGSGYTSLWPQSRRLDESSRKEAMAYVRYEFASDMGGTEILPALNEICNAMGDHRMMDVIILTDGHVWSAPETIGFVRSRQVISRGAARFFSLGIGEAVSHELVEGIAKAGGGYAEVITSASRGGWEDRVVAVLKAATTSHIGRLSMRLEWEEQDKLGPPCSFKQSPVDVSNLSLFLRNRVFLLFDSGEQHAELKQVVLQVQNPDGSITNKTILPKRLRQPDILIHKLAARALLGDLERGESSLQGAWGDRGSYADDLMIRAEAIELGCKWSLVSRWTSVSAVEEETTAPDEGMVMEMEVPEAVDGLDDALLIHRGGRVAASLTSRLPRLGAVVEENGGDSDDSESIPDTRFAGQSATGDNPDDDSNGDAINSGFNSNTGKDTDSGSGRSSRGQSPAYDPGEIRAPPEGFVPQDQSWSIEQLQPGGEQPSGVMGHSPENDALSDAQVPSPSGFQGTQDSNRSTPEKMCGPRKRKLSDDLDDLDAYIHTTESGNSHELFQANHLPLPIDAILTDADISRPRYRTAHHHRHRHGRSAIPLFSNLHHPRTNVPSGSETYQGYVPGPPSFGYSSSSASASAPIFNPPASTSLVRNVRPAAKAPDELAAEQFIRQLVLMQLSDGRFSFSDDDSVKATLGVPFLCLVTRLRSKLNSFDPAVAIAIVALLEEQFQGCRDLWVLMARKAADYITGCNLGSIVEELQQEARQSVKLMGSVMKELRDGEVAREAVTELENAPIS